MRKLLIFGGTTEGRILAEYCVKTRIPADVSVATEYGASLLPDGTGILCGRLDAAQMADLLRRSAYTLVIDATHPYAAEVTRNIRVACDAVQIPRIRLTRTCTVPHGRTVPDLASLTVLLDETDGSILSTLGSQSLPELTKIRHFRERLWVRVLPGGQILQNCLALGFDPAHVLQAQGPFTVGENLAHLRQCGAAYLVTKESGTTGGYPEKAEAARRFGAELITLVRPAEEGLSLEDILQFLGKEQNT